MSNRIPGSSSSNPIHYRGFEIFLEECPMHAGTWWTWCRLVPSCGFNEELCGNEWTEAACRQQIDTILGMNDNEK